MKWILIATFTSLQIIKIYCQNTIDSLKIIDYHVHFFSEELIDNLEIQGFRLTHPAYQVNDLKKSDYSNPEIILQQNNNAKIVLISTGYAFKDSTNLEAEKHLTIKENDILRRIVDTYPDNFYGFYGLNPLKEFTFEELKRCHEKLKLHGIKLHFQGNYIDLNNSTHLKNVGEIFKYLSENEIPALIHNNAWDLDGGEEYANLFIDKILNKHQKLKIIFAHAGGGGGFFKFTKDFLETMSKYLNQKNTNKHELFFELSSVVQIRKFPGSQDLKELTHLMKEIGYDKFLFGSDYPYRNSKTHIKEMMNMLDIDPKILNEIIERNILK